MPIIVTQASVRHYRGMGGQASQHFYSTTTTTLMSSPYARTTRRNWPAFQSQPNLRGLRRRRKWYSEVEARPTIVTQAYCRHARCTRTASLHPQQTIISPSMPSICARTTHKLISISAPAKSEGSTCRGRLVS